MGFLDKFRKRKEEDREQKSDDAQSSGNKQDSDQSSTAKRIKRYTSDGKPI